MVVSNVVEARLAVDARRLDLGVAQRHLCLQRAQDVARHQRQRELGKDRPTRLFALAQGEAVAADSRLCEGVGSVLLLFEPPVRADGEAHRLVVVPQVKQARVGRHHIDDGHAEVLDVVGHHVAGEPVLFLGVDIVVVRRREAGVVLGRELVVRVAGDEAVLVHHQIGRAERVPAGVVVGPGVAAQRLDHRRGHFLELVLLAVAPWTRSSPHRRSSPCPGCGFRCRGGCGCHCAGCGAGSAGCRRSRPRSRLLLRGCLGKAEQAPFLEPHILVEHDAAAVPGRTGPGCHRRQRRRAP